jgi:AcrR family transcriptional regulator
MNAPRDKEQTKTHLLQAVGRLLARSGFREVGVNAIAREAGVDKVLIYRYFGGLPELLAAFAEDSAFWPDTAELAQEADPEWTHGSLAERAKRILIGFGRALRKRPLTQEIMRWELLERNGLTESMARHREEQAERLFRELGRNNDSADLRAISSLLAAGQTYLILRSKTADVYNGLHLNSEEDWGRIERAIELLVDAVAKTAPMLALDAEPQRAPSEAEQGRSEGDPQADCSR